MMGFAAADNVDNLRWNWIILGEQPTSNLPIDNLIKPRAASPPIWNQYGLILIL